MKRMVKTLGLVAMVAAGALLVTPVFAQNGKGAGKGQSVQCPNGGQCNGNGQGYGWGRGKGLCDGTGKKIRAQDGSGACYGRGQGKGKGQGSGTCDGTGSKGKGKGKGR